MQAALNRPPNCRKMLKSRLADCEVSNVPDWLMKPAEFDPQRLTDIEKPIEKLMEDSQRITASVGAGALGGFVAKKVVDRIVGKKAFEKMATTPSEVHRGEMCVIGNRRGSGQRCARCPETSQVPQPEPPSELASTSHC